MVGGPISSINAQHSPNFKGKSVQLQKMRRCISLPVCIGVLFIMTAILVSHIFDNQDWTVRGYANLCPGYAATTEPRPKDALLINASLQEIYGPEIDKTLKLLFSRPFSLNSLGLTRGLYSLGDPTRLRRAMHKLLSGKPVVVAGMGTSILQGMGGDTDGRLPKEERTGSIFTIVQRWLEPRFPNATFINSALGGTHAVLHDVCFDSLLPPNVDILIVEESVVPDIGSTLGPNNVYADAGPAKDMSVQGTFVFEDRMAFERLVRRALKMQEKPGIMVINQYGYERSNRQFHRSIENDYNVISQYYGLPVLSARACCFHYMVDNRTGFRVDKVRQDQKPEDIGKSYNPKHFYYFDDIHPYAGTGHVYMADLLIHLMQQTIRSLIETPFSQQEDRLAAMPLPPPMIPNNYEMDSACLSHDLLPSVVIETEGFQWSSEKPEASTPKEQKWGWIGFRPGDYMKMDLDTRTSKAPPEPGSPPKAAVLAIAILKSYEHMGKVRVECVLGCECKPTTLDAHWEAKGSLVVAELLDVSQHGHCILKLTILNESQSGEHKFKVSGIIISGTTNMGGDMIHAAVSDIEDRAEALAKQLQENA